MNKTHNYNLTTQWTGNTGTGTSAYKEYERSYTVFADGKAEIRGSSDPAFSGDKTKHNPEDLLLASISSCHMLWYLHLCSAAGIVVTAYIDNATAVMIETDNGGGKFTEATLHPAVTITDASKIDEANALHAKANELCFVANSLNFPVHHKPVCKAGG